MVSWLRTLFRASRPKIDEETLQNDALALAMDWGEQWLAPIQPRLARQYPQLQPAELDACNTKSQLTMQFGHHLAYELVSAEGHEFASETFITAVRHRYPWISEENVTRLLRQSTYYALKTGGPVRR